MKKSVIPIKEICIIVLYFIFPMIIGTLLPGMGNSTNTQIIIRLFLELLLSLLFIFFYFDVFKKDLSKIRKDKIVSKSAWYTVLSIAAVAIINATIFVIMGDTVNPANSSIIEEYLKTNTIYAMLTVLLISPIKEEIVFRKALKDTLPNKIIFIIFSSIVYTVISVGYNFTLSIELLATIPVLAVSIIRAYSIVKTENIYTPIFVSVMYSLFVLATRLL